MLPIEPMGLSAKQWQFLSRPDKYVKENSALDSNCTSRQFKTARDILTRLNGSLGEQPRRGILLADDVGLGKTTVAALVAWVVASAGTKRKVRILVPNPVMQRRWVEELKSHVIPLKVCAPILGVEEKQVKEGRTSQLRAGNINVVTHNSALVNENLSCDLLIIDEAHRAKGHKSAFSKVLNRQKKNACRVLILTATPFSIHLDELKRMLSLIGGESAIQAVSSYSNALKDLYSGDTARASEIVAARLAKKAEAATNALSTCVIRHGVDDLPLEKTAFGDRRDWMIDVPPAQSEEIEVMLRMDRAMRLAKDFGADLGSTNDPRFHVGWRQFDETRAKLEMEIEGIPDSIQAIIKSHVRMIKTLRNSSLPHSKMDAVSQAVLRVTKQGEKVVLFCHYIATAQELTKHLDQILPAISVANTPSKDVWRKGWTEILEQSLENLLVDDKHKPRLETFIDWLCSDMIRSQTKGWLGKLSNSKSSLILSLRESRGRSSAGNETIADAATRLFKKLIDSSSTRGVLDRAGSQLDEPVLPGADGTSRVLAMCDPSAIQNENHLFLHNGQPDTAIAIFNSPFGPDVLVATDKISEGIDLHRYCRHLVHYELDPSPIRTIQRNGRLRRVRSWAAVTKQPILLAYPAFHGTRDHRLVQIMKKRVDSFSLLLGGVQDFDVDGVGCDDESWRNDVIEHAKKALKVAGGQLCARDPKET